MQYQYSARPPRARGALRARAAKKHQQQFHHAPARSSLRPRPRRTGTRYARDAALRLWCALLLRYLARFCSALLLCHSLVLTAQSLAAARRHRPRRAAWRHLLGDGGFGPAPSPPPPSGPPVPECPAKLKSAFTSQQGLCSGLQRLAISEWTEEACARACCWDASCLTYQWELDTNSSVHGGGCWGGKCAGDLKESTTWIGGTRSPPGKLPPQPPPPPNPPPPPAPPPMSSGPFAPSFDDSGWELLDVPHDFLINGTYDGSSPGSGTSYIPRNNSYYRKHFKLPSEWQGGAVWLQFEGVFQKAQVYVNGVFMYADEDPGYNGFSIQLSGADHVKYGTEENVIAMFVDGSPGSGWWCACQLLTSRM